ncbi:MAG: hypothetical protein ACRCWQ_05590, partial [Bacilli bacterium]
MKQRLMLFILLCSLVLPITTLAAQDGGTYFTFLTRISNSVSSLSTQTYDTEKTNLMIQSWKQTKHPAYTTQLETETTQLNVEAKELYAYYKTFLTKCLSLPKDKLTNADGTILSDILKEES